MLHYTISDNGKKPLILLHGFMEDTRIWDEMDTRLSEKFNLIKIDLPGHGKSKVYHEINSMDFMAEKVKEVIDFLDLQKINILGHSMGGYVSLAFAEKYAEHLDSLTLFFSTVFADDDEKKEIRSKSIRIIKESYSNFYNAGIPNFFNPFEREKLAPKIALAKKIASEQNPEGIAAAQLGMKDRPNRSALLEKFSGKILVIAGKYDAAVKTDALIKALPEKENTASYILNCGHQGHWEKPNICAEIILEEINF